MKKKNEINWEREFTSDERLKYAYIIRRIIFRSHAVVEIARTERKKILTLKPY